MQTFHSFMTSLSVLVFPPKKKTAQRGECGLTRERESRQLSQVSLSALTRSRRAPRILSRATSVKKSSIAHFKRVKPGKVNPSIKITHMKEQGSTFSGRDQPCLGTPLSFFFSLSLGRVFYLTTLAIGDRQHASVKKKKLPAKQFRDFYDTLCLWDF